MLLKIQERKRMRRFLRKLFKDTNTVQKEKYLNANYGISLRKLQNLINADTQNYTDTQIKNIKKLVKHILIHIGKSNYLNITAIASYHIAVSEFVDIAEQLKIDKEIIKKAVIG